jgi:hypothetical protein
MCPLTFLTYFIYDTYLFTEVVSSYHGSSDFMDNFIIFW